ncbi:hypothetical protein [Sulfurimonas sp.]|uniref:hypothetical protein n=1 Tax=Sulfurimonas sp. TaxID=2022749 RepID=UPI0035615207
MYYVIKKQHTSSLTTFISFQVPKYIASKNSENVIFEFQKDGKPDRKWVKKQDIILLTDDKEFFLKTVTHFKEVEATQQKLIDAAQEQLDQSIETFTETMLSEINEFSEIRDSSDVPCVLKDL